MGLQAHHVCSVVAWQAKRNSYRRVLSDGHRFFQPCRFGCGRHIWRQAATGSLKEPIFIFIFMRHLSARCSDLASIKNGAFSISDGCLCNLVRCGPTALIALVGILYFKTIVQKRQYWILSASTISTEIRQSSVPKLRKLVLIIAGVASPRSSSRQCLSWLEQLDLMMSR